MLDHGNSKQEPGETEFLRQMVAKPDWKGIGTRIKGYRLIKNLTEQDLAERLGTSLGTIKHLEEGKNFKSQNIIWDFIHVENVSIRWLYKGEGDYHSDDPPEYLPCTIVHERGRGIRRSDVRRDAEEGSFSGDPLEFICAIDSYKQMNRKPFPSWTEVYELFLSLGYRKVAPPKINPTGAR